MRRLANRCRRRQTWWGLSGLAVVYVSDWVMFGEVSVPVTRSTSAAPYVRGAGNSFWTSLDEGIAGEGEPPVASPQAIMMASGPESSPSCRCPSRELWNSQIPEEGLWMLIILCFCCAFAELALAENVPKPASARKTPARTINRPIKTRRLKKADCEADFFFMELVMMWMEF